MSRNRTAGAGNRFESRSFSIQAFVREVRHADKANQEHPCMLQLSC